MKKIIQGYKPPPKNIRRPKKPTPPPPVKRGLTVDEIISKYPMTVRILMVQLVDQIERLKKDQPPPEVPEIKYEWAGKKAREILDLIKQAQDEDLTDPVMDLHFLGLSLDIVTSIIDDLRPKNK